MGKFILGFLTGIVLSVAILGYTGHIETKTHDEVFTRTVTLFDGFDIK